MELKQTTRKKAQVKRFFKEFFKEQTIKNTNRSKKNSDGKIHWSFILTLPNHQHPYEKNMLIESSYRFFSLTLVRFSFHNQQLRKYSNSRKTQKSVWTVWLSLYGQIDSYVLLMPVELWDLVFFFIIFFNIFKFLFLLLLLVLFR